MDFIEAAFERHAAGDFAAAESFYRRSLAERNSADLWNNLGNVLVAQQKWNEGIIAFQNAIRLRPDFVEAYFNLTNTFNSLGMFAETIQCLKSMNTPSSMLNLNLGRAYIGRGETLRAIECFQAGCREQPNNFAETFNLAILYQLVGDSHQAEWWYRRALELQPDFARAWNNLGCLMSGQNRFREAHHCYQRAIDLGDPSPEIRVNLAVALQELGRPLEAKAVLETLHQTNPKLATFFLIHLKQHFCDWENLDSLVSEGESLIADYIAGADISDQGWQLYQTVTPWMVLAWPRELPVAVQRRCAERWSQASTKATVPLEHVKPPKRERLRIGYLSGDFRDHPVGYIAPSIMKAHDRSRFEVFAYSLSSNSDDPYFASAVSSADHLRQLDHLSDTEAARAIASDELDILIDLQGHTRNARSRILAMRPAPIQVNYLGYPGTSGASFIDYCIVDRTIAADNSADAFSEKLAFLPCYFPIGIGQRRENDTRPEPFLRCSRSEAGLPEDGFVFCVFSSTHKITSQMFSAWLAIIDQVPGSILWMRDESRTATDALIREANKISSNASGQIVFAPRVEREQHLWRQTAADLFLDTFPYNQHSSACDALEAGLPLLTYIGSSFASRVAASLLTTLELPELITTSQSSYIEMAIALAKTPDRLSKIRSQLRLMLQKKNPSLGEAYMRNVEVIYSSFIHGNDTGR